MGIYLSPIQKDRDVSVADEYPIDGERPLPRAAAKLHAAMSALRYLEILYEAKGDCWKQLENNDGTCWIPSGKRLQKTMEKHHFIAGKIHYFYGDFLCRKL